MFGNPKPFGTASTFGTSTFGNTSTAFGQSTTAFGSKPSTGNVFGGTSFGATPSTSMGGGLFGQTAPASTGGMFGQQQTGFGTPASTSTSAFGGFGATSTSGGMFGSSTPATQSSGGLFGNTSTSAFGSPRPTFGGFGATPASTGLFGQTNSTGTGLFGSSGGFAATATAGTTIKFNPPTGTDTMMKNGASTNIGTRHQCITCMKEYENKSLEELRMEDYAANRKGSSTATIGFGTPTQQPGLFGANTAASTAGFAFGATTQAKPLFGGTTATPNTFGSNNLFGQTPQTQNTGLFGKSVGFGTTSTAAAAPVFSFGGTSTGTSLFGQTNQQKPMFGQATGSTGLFGGTATTQSTGFGTNTGFGGFGATNQATTGLFGAKPTGFGTTNTTTTSTFSFGSANNMASGGLFGQKPAAPAFGTTGFGTQSSGFAAFNATPSTGTNLFGQAKPASTAFGTTGNMFGGGLNNSFGTSSFSMGLGANTGTGLFGATNTNKAPGFSFGNTGSTGFNFSGTNPGNSNFNFGQTQQMGSNDPNNLAAVQQVQQQILAMVANPFGYSPLFKNSLTETSRDAEILKPTNPAAQKALLNASQYKVSPLPTAKIKPKPWSSSPSGKLLFDGLENEELSLERAAFLPKKSIKKLVLRNTPNQSSFSVTSNSSSHNSTRIDVSISYNQDKSSPAFSSQQKTSPLTISITDSNPRDTRVVSGKDLPVANIRDLPIDGSRDLPISCTRPPSQGNTSQSPVSSHLFAKDIEDSFIALFPNKKKTSALNPNESDVLDTSANVNVSSNNVSEESETSEVAHPTGIVLKRPSYYTIPTLDELIPLISNNCSCLVDDFIIGREGYGKVRFPGSLNVFGLNLDEIVSFRNKEINVYPDENTTPPIGEGLNRKAVITLENVWPVDKTSHTLIKDPERIKKLGYAEKIERCTAKLGATLIDYHPETGSWTFQVDHFSKYGLEDSDEEMDEAALPPRPPPPQSKNFKSMGTMNPPNLQSDFGITFALPPDHEMEAISSQMPYSPLLDEENILNELSRVAKPILSNEIDVKRIQGMKATFFDEDMEEDMWISHHYAKKEKEVKGKMSSNNFSPYLQKRHKVLSSENETLPLHLVESFFKLDESGYSPRLPSEAISVTKSQDVYPTQALGLLAHSKHVSKCLSKIFLKTFEDSSLHNKQHFRNDAGLFMGRSFRCGWTAGGAVTSLARSKQETEMELIKNIMFNNNCLYRNGGPNFTVSLENMCYPSKTDVTEDSLVDALKVQLYNSISTVENGVPLFISKPGVEPIHSLAKFFKDQAKDLDPFAGGVEFMQQCVKVWDLLVSLWGHVDGLNHEQGVSEYTEQMARREAFSRWLISATEKDLSKQVANVNQSSEYLTKIYLYLCGRRISDSVKIAQQARDFRLSLLLSQAEGSQIVRKLIRKQLCNWKQNGAYDFLKYDRVMLYVLLSGMLVYENVNCCRGLDWKQALSLQIWYHCNPNASIQEVVKEYDDAFQGMTSLGKYALPPYPHYVNPASVEFEESEAAGATAIYDTCYHILKLFCDRSHRLDLLLMPETYSQDHLDSRLSWLLHLALSSIGYDVPANLAATLHSNFASQLESLDLWQWAIFVLLHHSDAEWKTKEVKDILLRNVSLDQIEETDSKEKFLIESLSIPINWIYEAKATKAHSLGMRPEEAWFLLKAGCWSKCHSIVVKHLASNAIINEEYDYLMKFLGELSQPDKCCTILDWPSFGQVYLDYINMCQVVKDILSQEVSAYDLEKFMPEIQSLCMRLSNIPTPSLKDKLAVAEMAKKTATILCSVAILPACSASVKNLCSLIKNLPMPHDYKAPETKFLVLRHLKTMN